MTKHRILVVVSDSCQRMALADFLVGWGYEVHQTSSAHSAMVRLRAAARSFVGIIVSLPHMDSKAFLDEHRSDQVASRSPILLAPACWRHRLSQGASP